jgi:hypothetical protein
VLHSVASCDRQPLEIRDGNGSRPGPQSTARCRVWIIDGLQRRPNQPYSSNGDRTPDGLEKVHAALVAPVSFRSKPLMPQLSPT